MELCPQGQAPTYLALGESSVGIGSNLVLVHWGLLPSLGGQTLRCAWFWCSLSVNTSLLQWQLWGHGSSCLCESVPAWG